jgi:hypothetical protein
MRLIRFVPLLATGMLMILHGFAHSPAVLGSWGIATFDDVSRQPNVWLTNAGDGLIWLFGLVWLLAAIAFIVAGVGIVRHAAWWPVATATALVASTPMTLLWREDAVVGLVLNGFILAGFLGWMLLDNLLEHQPA